jgi:hypothetical protein
LRQAIVEFCETAKVENDHQQTLFRWVSDCETEARHLSGRCYADDKLHDEPIYERCLQALHLVRSNLEWIVSRLRRQGAIENWFQLGQYIAAGDSLRIGPPYRLLTDAETAAMRGKIEFENIARYGVMPCPQKQADWALHEDELVGTLMVHLAMTSDQLMPNGICHEVGQDLFPDVPKEYADGWLRIEAGMRQLANRLEHDDQSACVVDGQQTDTQVTRLANQERDAWLYKLCCEGVPYMTIGIRLKKRSKKTNWEVISKPSSIRAAAIRHANRHGLTRIPRRQHGRKRTTS